MKRRKIAKNDSSHQAYQPHQKPVHTAKKSLFYRINTWLQTHKKASLAILIGLLLLIGGALLYFLFQPQSFPTISQLQKKEKKYYSPLTGVEVSEEATKRPVTAVIVENSPEARPQSGLKESGVVFESIAEAGISRFLLLYQEAEPEIIGPVRSVRPHFASWAAAFDAGLAHVGGSAIPLQKLRSGQIKDLDEFLNTNSYYRAADRYAPHNTYTSDQRLQAANAAKGYTSSNFTAWDRKKRGAPEETPTAQSIAIPVSTGLFAVSYQWDAAENHYLRSQGGSPHVDREKGQITPDVVIAMQVPHDVIQESNGFRYPNVIGTGTAWIFQNGEVINATWSKTSDAAQITFEDEAGDEISLNPGQTWISAIPEGQIPSWQ